MYSIFSIKTPTQSLSKKLTKQTLYILKNKSEQLTLTLASVKLVHAAISSLVAKSGYLFLVNVASNSCNCCDVKWVRWRLVRCFLRSSESSSSSSSSQPLSLLFCCTGVTLPLPFDDCWVGCDWLLFEFMWDKWWYPLSKPKSSFVFDVFKSQ